MSLEEKIKEAYGEHYETVKNHIDDNGWCILNVSQKEPINDFAHHGETEWKPINGRVCWRPKSLQGIENNNGWIKIESEADLPKEEITYWALIGGEIEVVENWEITLSFHNKRTITHYQPIEKPKDLPIY